MKSTSSNLSNSNVWCKIKIYKFGTKNAWFAYFLDKIWKYYFHIWNLRPRICLVAKFGAKTKIMKKTKMPKFGTKNASFGYFALEFENNIVIFEISNPNLSNCKISRKKQKCLNLWPRMTYLGIFWLEFENDIVIFDWNQHPRICQTAKFREKMKMPKFRTKNVLFEYFRLEF